MILVIIYLAILVAIVFGIVGTPIFFIIKDGIQEEKQRKIEYAKQNEFFDGVYELQCLGSKDSSYGKFEASGFSGSFKAAGVMNGTESIKFIWKNYKLNQLFPTVLPANKVRICVLKNTDNRRPYVIFSWYNTKNYNTFVYEWVEHIACATIYIQENLIDNSIYFKFDTK